MANELMVTVVGWAASTPREVVGDGVPFTSFRVATTPRWFDSRQGTWTDGRTEWFTAKAFRDVALNVAASVHKGDPVVVHGKLRTEEWIGENGPRTGLTLEITAVGHDLTRGRSEFTRRTYTSGSAGATTDGTTGTEDAGPPEDDELARSRTEDGAGEVDPWEVPAEQDEARTSEDVAALTP
ncbi:single-stranded DNA-binding protein [Actinotalea sp. BY-33]|uniref:Single-stranded DNA-binding protein n=1 Tax=Actinotalea soli TaxID=2819234 RepID=A0A939LS38_9CELL|nr:single-stranded DNA-binding protein [Actinotalea soli]MBO1751650.1 single-stranded DNA-binding protein [Actinotalea soli]